MLGVASVKIKVEEAELAELNALLSEIEDVFGDDMSKMKDFQPTLELNQGWYSNFLTKIYAFCSEECDRHRVRLSSGWWHIIKKLNHVFASGNTHHLRRL